MFNNSILKIVKPIWYFSIPTKEKKSYWVDYKGIESKYLGIIDKNNFYDSKLLYSYDLAYQLWNKGFISFEPDHKMINTKISNISINDQYIFLRRMFNPVWIYYTIILRILTFKVTFQDIKSFFGTINIKKVDLNDFHFKYDNYNKYKSILINEQPLISIIIPTLNRYSYLSDALRDLELQDYVNFEVIIVDQSDPFKEYFYEQFKLNIKVIYQEDKALWKARNTALKLSKGKYILLYDDDSRITTNWISEHLKCLDYFKADISAGVSKSTIGAPVPKHYDYFRWADQLDTGNVLLKRDVFKKCGLFDTQFEKMRMGDGEFGLRAYLNDFRSINNPYASRVHLKASSGGLREMGSWDSLRPTNWMMPIPIPSVLYFFRKYWGRKNTILYLIQTIPISLTSYNRKERKISYIISIFFFTVLFPLVLIQIIRSWHTSGEMLKSGSKIETFK